MLLHPGEPSVVERGEGGVEPPSPRVNKRRNHCGPGRKIKAKYLYVRALKMPWLLFIPFLNFGRVRLRCSVHGTNVYHLIHRWMQLRRSVFIPALRLLS